MAHKNAISKKKKKKLHHQTYLRKIVYSKDFIFDSFIHNFKLQTVKTYFPSIIIIFDSYIEYVLIIPTFSIYKSIACV